MSDSERLPEDAAEARRQRAARLLEILRLERVEDNLYRGLNEVRGQYRLFGGQVLAQALWAASATVSERKPHSVHGYFMRAGNADIPVIYEVDRIRDGRSFTTRRVVAVQEGQAIFSMSVSFQIDEQGFQHAAPMPNVPLPDELEDDLALVSRLDGEQPHLSPMAGRPRPFEIRSVFQPGTPASADERFWNPVWIRFAGDVPGDDQSLARALLAYASDMGLVSTTVLPHAGRLPRSSVQLASLDHGLWIHRDVKLDGWLLFHKHTSTAQGARGLVHAAFYDEQGVLVASVTQEGLVREYRPPTAR